VHVAFSYAVHSCDSVLRSDLLEWLARRRQIWPADSFKLVAEIERAPVKQDRSDLIVLLVAPTRQIRTTQWMLLTPDTRMFTPRAWINSLPPPKSFLEEYTKDGLWLGMQQLSSIDVVGDKFNAWGHFDLPSFILQSQS
jgi:hypothetical protein